MTTPATAHPDAGRFVWHELMTSDAPAAEAFYAQVVGWTMADAGMPGMRYTLLGAADRQVGGLMALPPEACAAGARPGWMGYVGVDDVDAAAERAQALGGRLLRPGEDIPGVGRFAVIADPHGAVITLFRDTSGSSLPPAAGGTPGHIGWNELHAGALEADAAFYQALFGWVIVERMDMGPNGVYLLFARREGEPACGGMVQQAPEVPAPFWNYYVNVDDIDAALARLNQAGGRLLHGPHQVPGGSWIVLALDPQGAAFALVGPRR